MPLLGRLYLSGCHASSWQALLFWVSCLFLAGFIFLDVIPLRGRLYLSGYHASSWQALPFLVSCLFFAGFTFLGVMLLCRLYLSGSCSSLQALPFCVSCFFVGFTFIFSCKIGILYGSAEVDQEKMRTTDLEIMDFDIQILIMPKWTRSNS
jgi:hypothetical protein